MMAPWLTGLCGSVWCGAVIGYHVKQYLRIAGWFEYEFASSWVAGFRFSVLVIEASTFDSTHYAIC